MKIKIVTRHPGTVAWLASKGITGLVLPQASPSDFNEGDVVYGVLPIHLIDEALKKGARVILTVLPQIASAQRGQELTPQQMDEAGAKLLEVVSLQLKEVSLK